MRVRQKVFDTYWYLAAERQNIFFKRLEGLTAPYSEDPILRQYKFCNAYRASDRVSQFLIRNVIYPHIIPTAIEGSQNFSPSLKMPVKVFSPKDTLFRIFLFRLFNKIDTWQELEKRLGIISFDSFDRKAWSSLFNSMYSEGRAIYGNAFILCATKAYGYDKKHDNHLALLEEIFIKIDTWKRLMSASSLQKLFLELKKLPLIGDFMAYQIAIDMNYSEVFDFDENDFTIAGPGAKRGIAKCFEDTDGKSSEYIIKWMVENQDKEFERLSLNFQSLWGRKLHAIDCQGLFCETDKYSRVKFPELLSNRTRIKVGFQEQSSKISYFYPPKWKINHKT